MLGLSYSGSHHAKRPRTGSTGVGGEASSESSRPVTERMKADRRRHGPAGLVLLPQLAIETRRSPVGQETFRSGVR